MQQYGSWHVEKCRQQAAVAQLAGSLACEPLSGPPHLLLLWRLLLLLVPLVLILPGSAGFNLRLATHSTCHRAWPAIEGSRQQGRPLCTALSPLHPHSTSLSSSSWCSLDACGGGGGGGRCCTTYRLASMGASKEVGAACVLWAQLMRPTQPGSQRSFREGPASSDNTGVAPLNLSFKRPMHPLHHLRLGQRGARQDGQLDCGLEVGALHSIAAPAMVRIGAGVSLAVFKQYLQ